MRTVLLATTAGLVAFLVLGNLAIFTATTWARRTVDTVHTVKPAGVKNFRPVSESLWRGAAPTEAGYRSLASLGVATVVDLRAEDNLVIDEAMLSGLGVKRFHLPIRDGQAPPAETVRQFIDIVRQSKGTVFVHCGAGVGRTGAMVAAYLVATGQAEPSDALERNLAVGPPSLEQVAYVAGLDPEFDRPGPALVAVSRMLDAPRRLWSRYGL